MSAVTWGVSKGRRATVFCNSCREVFAQNIPVEAAQGEMQKASESHYCTPPKPWRPGPAPTHHAP